MSATKEDYYPFAYFKSLDIENIKCFKGKHHIDLTDKEGKPAKWTVIMGNNGTGKTTILRCLADLYPEIIAGFGNEKNEFIESFIFAPKNIDKTLLPDKKNSNNSIKSSFINKGGLDIVTCEISNQLKNIESIDNATDVVFSSNLLAYGIHRRISESKTYLPKYLNNNTPLILNQDGLMNPEEWLLKTFLARQNGVDKAALVFEKVLTLLKKLLPDVHDLKIVTDEDSLDSFVLFKTNSTWVRLQELGYGYQSSIAWLVDLSKQMFDFYSDYENPLAEPAVVLVDEIALHLHPDWQRDIISFLDAHFPKTQFIVTTHSPLIVQSAENVNLVILEKNGEGVRISQPKINNLQGWSIEEIMSDIMGLNDEIFSDEYLELMKKFEEALDKESYEMAKETYDKLDKILHPSSTQRALMRMQMAGILPIEA